MWYYTVEGQSYGPVSPDQLRSVAGPDTYVWKEGLAGWLPLMEVAELRSAVAPAVALAPVAALLSAPEPTRPTLAVSTFEPAQMETAHISSTTAACSECAQTFPTNLMMKVPGPHWVCGQCRSLWQQKVREGYFWRNDPVYNRAGVSSRFNGYFLDGLIWGVIGTIMNSIIIAITNPIIQDMDQSESTAITICLWAFIALLGLVVRGLVEMWALSSRGSTWGQRQVALKVIDSSGRFPSPSVAFARSVTTNLLGLVFPIAFLTVCFDEQGRAPSDFLLGTRVVYNRLK